MKCATRLFVLVLALACGLPLGGAPVAAAARRTVTATATCTPGTNSTQPEVTVKVTNHSGHTLIISYLHGFTTPQAFQPRMTMVDPGTFARVTVGDGKSRTLTAPWDDLRTDPADAGGAIVVTNLGEITPLCTDNPADQGKIDLAPAPASGAARKREGVEIAAKTFSQLESWRAYPALYALLHPDASAAVSFNAVACWYADQYGTPDAPADQGVLTTTIKDVTFSPWTWSLNGKQYADAATATVEQAIGTVAKSKQTTSTEHLVAVDGQWRWFFGASKTDVANLDTHCDLGAGAITGTPSGSSGQSNGGDTGSITLTMYTCPAEMTVDSLDPSACVLDPGAATWTLTGAPLDQPLTWADVTQHGGPGYSWEGLAFGEYIITPDALPDGATGYAVTGSNDAARQDAGIALQLGSDDPNMRLSIYLFGGANPGAVTTGSLEIDFYDCQPGMTPDTFEPTDCTPLPQGFANVTVVPGPDVPSDALPNGPIMGATDGTNLGGGRFALDGLPLGTYKIGPGQNYQGPLLYAPDYAAEGDSGIAASTYQVTITVENPNPVIALYRLSSGVS